MINVTNIFSLDYIITTHVKRVKSVRYFSAFLFFNLMFSTTDFRQFWRVMSKWSTYADDQIIHKLYSVFKNMSFSVSGAVQCKINMLKN
jgi:hypothetical protein